MLKIFRLLIKQELKLVIRQPVMLFAPVGFVLVSLLLFILGLEPSAQQVRAIAPSLVITLTLLSALIQTDQLFRPIHQSKQSIHFLLGKLSLSQLVWLRTIWHFTVTGIPILLLSPILALMLYLNMQEFLYFFIVLLLVTSILSLWAVFCGAITSDTAKGHLIAPILILPMLIPTLICATMALKSALALGPFEAFAALLLANLLVLIAILPWVVSKVLDAIWRG